MLRQTVYELPGGDSQQPLQIALAGDKLALSFDGGRVSVFSVASEARLIWSRTFPFEIKAMSLSPDGHFLQVTSEDSSIVWNLTEDNCAIEMNEGNVSSAMSSLNEETLLVRNIGCDEKGFTGHLNGILLPSMKELFDNPCQKATRILRIYPLYEASNQFSVNYMHFSDLSDNILTLSLDKLMQRGEYYMDAIAGRDPSPDGRGYDITTGPVVGTHEAVFWRDPRGDESRDEEDADEYEYSDLYAFCGFYFVDLRTRQITQKIELPVEVSSVNSLCADKDSIWFISQKRLFVLDRHSKTLTELLNLGEKYHLDAANRAIADLKDAQTVRLIQLG